MGLAPEAFWALSLNEWAAAVSWRLRASGVEPGAVFERTRLDALMMLYPDG